MSQNIVYKTYEINTDVEHYAKPINLSGASTVKLTDLPAGVKCWISTESTGENKFPLINRGDGWVNLPAPLYDLYIYTEGVTIDNKKIVLNYTGQNDFFVYGNNSSEKIEQIGQIISLSKQTIKDVNDAVYNTYMRDLKHRFLILGKLELITTNGRGLRYVYLPNGFNKISTLGLEDDKYYRISFMGHFDLGNGLEDSSNEWNNDCQMSISSHFSIFKNTAGATFTELTSKTSGAGLYFDFDNMYMLNKAPYAKTSDRFELWGGKYKELMIFHSSGLTSGAALSVNSGTLNPHSFDFIMRGEYLNAYDYFGIFWKINSVYDTVTPMTNSTPSSHASLLLEISEVIS